MERPSYLSRYKFDWELFDVILGGKSSLDAKSFLGDFSSREKVYNFMESYGLEQTDPVMRAELFGVFQEAIQFIKRYFLKENNSEGIDISIPGALMTITEVSDLFVMAGGRGDKKNSPEEKIWAGITLKVMHTILHADKDLRHNYYSVIQQQILDRFYKYLRRNSENQLVLGADGQEQCIPLFDFTTKVKKSRDSIIIKMLHKVENVAEELFDRMGVRFITNNKVDTLRVVKFLQENNIIVPHNIKPSRSLNSLIDMDIFRKQYKILLRKSIRERLNEEEFFHHLEKAALEATYEFGALREKNVHSSQKYRSIHFTCRQLIKYKNPILKELNIIRRLARAQSDQGLGGELTERVLNLETSLVAKDIRFFYPFEVQVVDIETHRMNTEGEASHNDYKKNQLRTAMMRLFRPLIEYKKILVV